MKAINQFSFYCFIFLLPMVFQSCQSDEAVIDEPDPAVLATIDNIDERIHYLEVSETTSGEPLSITLVNEVSVQHSDDEKLVMVVYGSGQWQSYGNISLRESRVIDISDRTSEGEGVIDVEGYGRLYYITESIRYPIPGSGSVDEWTMQLFVYDGTGDFRNVTGSATYTIRKSGESFMNETATIEGRLNNL
jgi:hypothetical protein